MTQPNALFIAISLALLQKRLTLVALDPRHVVEKLRQSVHSTAAFMPAHPRVWALAVAFAVGVHAQP